MFDIKILRRVGLLTLIFFVWFSVSADYGFAQDEDDLLNARKMYQQGDYEGAISVLTDFINKLKAIAAHKKNVAEAFYLLAKVYYTVGEDAKVENNLNRVFETYPNFTREETDLEFKDRVEKAKINFLKGKKEVYKPLSPKIKKKQKETKVIPKPVKKKKKKFPVLLVVGGLVVVGALVYFLLIKKSKEEEEQYDIRGYWDLIVDYPDGSYGNWGMEFFGGLTSGNFNDTDGYTGTYTVNGKNVNFLYHGPPPWEFRGTFSNKTNMNGTWTYESYSDTWRANRTAVKAKKKSTSISKNKERFAGKIE